MACTISEYYTDEELISQLRLHFDPEEMFDFDFKTILNHITDNGEVLELRFRKRVFHIDKITADVEEV